MNPPNKKRKKNKKVCKFLYPAYFCTRFGEMPEWSNGAVSKTVVLFMGTKGSNPFLSAEKVKSRSFL